LSAETAGWQRRRVRVMAARQPPREVDTVAQVLGRLLALFEMKSSTTVSSEDFRHMDWFLMEGPDKAHRGTAFVIYLGEQTLSLGPGPK